MTGSSDTASKKKGRKRIIALAIIALVVLVTGTFLSSAGTRNLTQSSDELLYACAVTPHFVYQSQTYAWAPNTSASQELSSQWVRVGKIGRNDLPEASQEALNFLRGCSLWGNPEHPEALYVKIGTEFQMFATEVSRMPWMAYDGAQYLYEDTYLHYFDPVDLLVDNTLPAHAVSLGTSRFGAQFHLPTADLQTNAGYISNKEVFWDPARKDILYVAIPNGGFVDGELVIRYDRYIRTDAESLRGR